MHCLLMWYFFPCSARSCFKAC